MEKSGLAVVLCVVALGLGGCTEEQRQGFEPTAKTEEAIDTVWQDADYPPVWTDLMVGVAGDTSTDNGVVYTWYTDGWGCKGLRDDLCSISMFQYLAPDVYINIMGISRYGNIVYTYYRDGTYSRGTPTNLQAYSGKAAFNHQFYNMEYLIDVDINPTDSRSYYYWSNSPMSTGVRRTVGTTADCCSSTPDQNSMLAAIVDKNKGRIVGIAFLKYSGLSPQWREFTWYEDGHLNESVDTRDLDYYDYP